MTHLRRTPALLAACLLLVGGAPTPIAAQSSSPTPCAPPALADPPLVAVPGGNAANGVAQPGPIPATAPLVCWVGTVGNLLNGGSIGATGDTVIVPSDTGELAALGPDGTERWRYRAGESALAVRALDLDAGSVYVATPTGVASVSISDGSESWRTAAPISSADAPVDAIGAFSAVLSGTTLLTTQAVSTDGFTYHRTLVALDTATGASRWSVSLPDDGIVGKPATDGTVVVLAAGDGGVHAFDLATGAPTWTADDAVIGGSIATDLAFAANLVLVGLTDGTVAAVSTTDGSAAWHSAASETPGVPIGLAAAGGMAYLNTGVQLIAIDTLTGATPWGATIQPGPPMMSFRGTPAVVDGAIVVGTTDGSDVAALVAISDAGTELWRVPTEIYGALMSPVVIGSRVYTGAFGIMDGGLVAFGTP